MIQWAYTFENYQGKENQSLIIAKNFVKDYELMRKENIGLYSMVRWVAERPILPALLPMIEQYQISVKIRNFAQIINELQKADLTLIKRIY